MTLRRTVQTCGVIAAALVACATQAQPPFTLEEASIADIHNAIRAGSTTCTEVVQGYVARARAYNGVCTELVTADGRAGRARPPDSARRLAARRSRPRPLRSRARARLRQYKGKRPTGAAWSRRLPTRRAAAIRHGGRHLPNAGRSTRSRRSISAASVRSRARASSTRSVERRVAGRRAGRVRGIPQAARCARARRGARRDLRPEPRARRCRSTACHVVQGGVRHQGHALHGRRRREVRDGLSRLQDRRSSRACATPARSSTRKAHNAEYNAGSGNPGGDAKVERPTFGPGGARETWGGTTCNPYDTERETGGSSGGSGASVAANLVVCSICETTGGSCRGPAPRTASSLVPTKGMISYGGGIGANPYRDRPGIHCRSVKDAATVLDAFRDKQTGGYFDPRDIYTALPR